MEVSKFFIDLFVIALLCVGMYGAVIAYTTGYKILSPTWPIVWFVSYMIALWIYIYATIGIDLANWIGESI